MRKKTENMHITIIHHVLFTVCELRHDVFERFSTAFGDVAPGNAGL